MSSARWYESPAHRRKHDGGLRRIDRRVDFAARFGNQFDLRLVQQGGVVHRRDAMRARQMPKGVELHEVGTLQRTGDSTIARPGEADDGRHDPEDYGQDNRVPLRVTRRSWPAKASQNRHGKTCRDYRSATATTKPGSGGSPRASSAVRVQEGCRH